MHFNFIVVKEVILRAFKIVYSSCTSWICSLFWYLFCGTENGVPPSVFLTNFLFIKGSVLAKTRIFVSFNSFQLKHKYIKYIILEMGSTNCQAGLAKSLDT